MTRSVVGILVVIAVAFAPAVALARKEGVADAPDDRARAEAQLDQVVREVDFKGHELADVMDFMRDVTGASIVVNWRALESIGVKKDTPVTVKGRELKARVVLAKVFDAVGTAKGEPTFEVRDGVVVVSSTDGLRRMVAAPTIPAELDRRMPEINFAGQGLGDVVDFMRDVTGLKIVVDWEALRAAKVDRLTPVSARVKDAKVSTMIAVILDDVGGDARAGAPRPVATFADGVLTITARKAPATDAAKDAKPKTEAK
jgi:hypothetical protein